MDLSKRFAASLAESDLIKQNDRILVAFSGGKDSVCLLSLLHTLRNCLGIEIGACHIHHGIRKEEAEEDLLFCRNFCHERDIPFYYKRVDVPAFSKKERMGLEEGARILRYRALEEIRKNEGFDKIATAHTASDQGETVLFRLIRGSGFLGTSGVPEKRGVVIRPLLPFFSEEIQSFLEEYNLPFIKDSSNDDNAFSRNRIRNHILPEMEEISKGAVKSLVRFSAISAWQTQLNDTLCNLWEKKHCISYENSALPLSALWELAENKAGYPVLYTALSRLLKNEKIVMPFERFERLIPLLKTPVEGKIIEIPSAFCLLIEKGFLHLKKNERTSQSIEYQVEIPLGETVISPLEIRLTRSDKRDGKVENINKNHLIIHLAFDKIEGDLFARNRRDGDSIIIDGMTRSIKKLFQEAKIPAADRDKIPLICDKLGIVWIPFVGLCDRVRHSETGKIFTLCLDFNESDDTEGH